MIRLLVILLFPVLSTNAQSVFDRKISDSAEKMVCKQPEADEPVTFSSKLVFEKDSVAIIVKIALAPGWHIYQYVPSTLPYIAIEHILELPQNMVAVGDWTRTKATTSASDPGVLIYENEALFVHKAIKRSKGNAQDVIKTGLYYQACDLYQCLPPVEKIFTLTIGK